MGEMELVSSVAAFLTEHGGGALHLASEPGGWGASIYWGRKNEHGRTPAEHGSGGTAAEAIAMALNNARLDPDRETEH